MTRKTFTLLASLLAVCAVLTTAVFAVQESGWFRTDTGTGLNLILDWDVVRPAAGETVEVSVAVALEHYALHVGARTVTLTIGDQAFTAEVPAIHSDSNNTLQTLTLTQNTMEFSCAAGETLEVPVSAAWDFHGVYAGKKIDTLTVEKTLVITENSVEVRDGIAHESVVTITPDTPTDNETDAVGGAAYAGQWELRSDSGTWLNLVCEVQAADALDGNAPDLLDVTAALYLEYYSLWMSPKSGSLTVGETTVDFTTTAIAEESNTRHRVCLRTLSLSCTKGQTIEIAAEMPFWGTYSGKPLERVTLTGSITLD